METMTSDARAVNENGMGLTCMVAPEYQPYRNKAHASLLNHNI